MIYKIQQDTIKLKMKDGKLEQEEKKDRNAKLDTRKEADTQISCQKLHIFTTDRILVSNIFSSQSREENVSS